MPDDFETHSLEPDSPTPVPDAKELSQAYGELRELLLAGERRRLADLERRLDEMGKGICGRQA